MKVLVLGGSGYIGSRLCATLAESGWAEPVSASRRAAVDATDAGSLKRALRGMDAVVNCVAGSAEAIAQGARVLVHAANDAGCQRIVHLSTMSVYGALEGEAREDAPRDGSIGWYAKAKCEAEDAIAAFASHGGSVVMLRPGCVWGPGSELWVGRIGRWLRAGRLGDLGAAGDGWSNLVAVQDVCAAILASLRQAPAGGSRVYNLAAPDSPRWNDYFVDLALAIGATPVKRLSARQLKLDARLAGPPLKVLEILLKKAGRSTRALPDPLPPGLLGVFERQLHLRSERAQQELGLRWTPYEELLQSAAEWFLSAHPRRGSGAERAVQVPRT
ncbi:NAD-dependent epimerase/dehydratase family protein [Ramlibacter solisilvae]|uniref:NAD-dependent epimerase/dehydratase family protein n=1 Tax=Ramlibacter tataouinensis TaxID=94132 RepID=UPI0007774209|nr:NAD-dependent epimerase/dehydratase family protein [Ramlibacter tataouinensis]